MRTRLSVIILLTALLCSELGYAQKVRTMKYRNGNVYTGEFDGRTRESGYGTMKYYNGNVYEGNWLKGKPHGEGVLTYANNGGRFEGNWEDGKMVGKGIIYFPNGDVLEATFTDGESLRG